MRAGLVPGLTGEIELAVTEAMVARFDELGLAHPVYSTWMMAKHMEEASRKVILPFLEQDEDAVGHAIDIVHLAPTAIGERVRIRATLERVDGRRVYCTLEAHNRRERIGAGRNIQVVMSRERLHERFRAIGAVE